MAVFDQGYQRWNGEFKRSRLRWLPMVRYQVALTLKRRIIWLILFLAIVPSLGFCGVIYFSTEMMESARLSPDMVMSSQLANGEGEPATINPLIDQAAVSVGALRGMTDPSAMTRSEKYWLATSWGFYYFLMIPQSFIVLLVTSAVGSGLIAQDIRSNALEIYLTKPITAMDYILGKLSVIVFFILIATFLPAMLVFTTASMSMQNYFDVAWPIVPRIFAACLLASLVNGIFMLGLSSLAKSSRYATVIWFALCLVSSLVSLVLTNVTGNDNWLFLGYRNNFSYLVAEIFGGGLMQSSAATWQEAPTSVAANPLIPIAILSAVVILSILIMRKTIRSVENR